MNELIHAPVFGHTPLEGAAVVRPSAYGLIVDGPTRLAVVRTPQGHFLPGGGIEPGEQPHQALVREAGEECGLQVQVGAWGLRAIDFVYSETERRHFEKRSIFFEAHSTGRDSRRESDHELRWLTPAEAIAELTHPSHQWAVAKWAAEREANSRITRQWT
jgi:8-oxo-dGTP diphosphatase